MIRDIQFIADSSAPIEANPLLVAGVGESEDTSPLEFLNGERILIGLSGGINSMAVLCHLIELGIKPKEVHLFYAHFAEHSPDTFQFVADGIRYARKHFDKVIVKITSNNVLNYFEQENMIPHPKISPCSKTLKVMAINEYAFNNNLRIDLVGYVKNEMKTRAERQQKTMSRDLFSLDKIYTIAEYTDEWCFEISDKHIGWHPAIYDIRDENGKRIFKHNNCLPCKNMSNADLEAVKTFYPTYHKRAMQTVMKLKAYFGRDKDLFYATFGRDLGQPSTCEVCEW